MIIVCLALIAVPVVTLIMIANNSGWFYANDPEFPTDKYPQDWINWTVKASVGKHFDAGVFTLEELYARRESVKQLRAGLMNITSPRIRDATARAINFYEKMNEEYISTKLGWVKIDSIIKKTA